MSARPDVITKLFSRILMFCVLIACGGGGGNDIIAQSQSSTPVITTQPASQTVTAGQTATFAVTATGTAPLSYQWMKNNTAISGATAASYTTPVATISDNGGTFTVVVSNGNGSVTSGEAVLMVNNQGDNFYYGIPAQSRADILRLVSGTTYYLDGDHGNDSNDGLSEDRAWKTISKTQSAINSGDCVIVLESSAGYEAYSSVNTISYSTWTIYMAKEGNNPVFKHIYISNSAPTTMNLIFYGINLSPDKSSPEGVLAGDISTTWRSKDYDGDGIINGDEIDAWVASTGSDASYFPESDEDTYLKTSQIVNIKNVNKFRVYNSKFTGLNKHLTRTGVTANYCSNIVFENCEMQRITAPFMIGHSSYITLRGNYTHDYCRSNIYLTSNDGHHLLIEKNNSHFLSTDFTEPYAPKRTGAQYHGSLITNGYARDITIRNNIFHGMVKSYAIIFSPSDDSGASSYDNVLIENNLLYDTKYCTFYNPGENFVIRNNIFSTFTESGRSGTSKYHFALYLGDPANGRNGSDISIYNNIFIGSVNLQSYVHTVKMGNNIFWSLNADSDNTFISNGTAGFETNKIITSSNSTPAYFDSGFFAGEMDFSLKHGKILDFTFAAGSEGINFGDPRQQPADSLGTLVAGFIQDNGAARNASRHSAGPYEYQ